VTLLVQTKAEKKVRSLVFEKDLEMEIASAAKWERGS